MKGTVFFRQSKASSNAGRAKKQGTWTYAFSVNKADGSRRQVTKGGFATKKECESALTDRMADFGASPTAAVEPSKMALERYLRDEWLPVIDAALKPSTATSYRDLVEAYVIPHLGDLRLCDVTQGQVAKLYTTLRTSGRRRARKNGDQSLSESTVRHVHVVLSAAFGHAVEAGLLRHSPIAALPRKSRPKQTSHTKPEIQVWTAEQAQTFIEATAGDRLGAMFDLDLNTGLRRGELVALRWDDVDLDRGTLAVRRNRVTVNYAVSEGTPKSRTARVVDIDAETVAMLRRHRRRQLEERMAWGEAWTETGLVFTRQDGTALHPQTATWHFHRLARAAGVPVLRLHDLRHTHATLGLAAGVPPKVMQERLGHSSIQITMDLYSHVIPGMQADAAAKIAGLLRQVL